MNHLRPRYHRVASFSAVAWVVEPDGRALISAWSTEHDRFERGDRFDTTIEWTLPDGTSIPRYYDIYDPVEFRSDLESSTLSIVETEISSWNCYAVVTTD